MFYYIRYLAHMGEVLSSRARKGRGAVSNATGRF